MQKETMICLSLDQVVANWQKLSPHLEGAQLGEDYNTEYIQSQIAKGHIQVWVIAGDLVVLTQIATVPNGDNIFQVIWAHGDFPDERLAFIFDVFQRFACLAGCKRIDLRGRTGWTRKLRKLPGVKAEVLLSCPVGATGWEN